jgi:hypothetical protein
MLYELNNGKRMSNQWKVQINFFSSQYSTERAFWDCVAANNLSVSHNYAFPA